MAFTVPNEADAFHANQSELDKVDLDILVAGYDGNGVVSGCAVTAQGTPDMTVAVAAGVAIVGGAHVTVAGGNVTITAADGTNPRLDLIVVNNAGTKSATAGTAAANPVFPAIPANSIVLAAVYVPASDTAIESNQITDKRVILGSLLTPGMLDAADLFFGTGQDAGIRWSTGDADNHSLVIGLGDSNQGLHITDKAAIATDWNIAATTHPNLYLHSNTTPATDYLRLGGHDGTNADIDVVGGTTLRFAFDGSAKATLGSTTGLDLSNGQGNIVFPGTATLSAGANTLDDYEEGTWTPTVQDSSLSNCECQTYSVQTGHYTKVGNLVTFTGKVTMTSLGTLLGSVAVRLAGLPFTTTSGKWGTLNVGTASGLAITANANVTGNYAFGSTYAFLREWNDATGVSDLLISELSDDGNLTFSGFYYTCC